MSARTSRRKRCNGPCGELYPPERLARVGGRESLCPECLLAEAESLGVTPASDVAAQDEQERLEAQYGEAMLEPAPAPPDPLPLRSDEERFEGMVERQVDGWPLMRGRLSASSLGTFLRCPEQFRRQYVLGERRPSGGTGLAGTAAHGAVEAAVRLRLERGQVASAQQLADTYDAVFDSAVDRAADREGIVWGVADKVALDADSARTLGRRAVAGYAESLPLLDAVEVERVFVFELAGVAVPICGLIDVAGARSTTDLKFGGQVSASVKPDWRVQAQVYGLAARLPVDFHTTSWAGKVQTHRTHPRLRHAWSAREALLAANIVRAVVEGILMFAEHYGERPWLPNVQHTWACDRCEFKPDCAWWNVPAGDIL